MSPGRRRTAAKRAVSSFVPLCVAGEDAARRESVGASLAAALDVPLEALTPKQAARLARGAAGCGVVVLVDDEGAVEGALALLRAADASIPVVAAVSPSSPEAAIRAFRAGVQDVMLQAEPSPDVVQRMRTFIVTRATRGEGSLFGDGPGLPRMLGGSGSMRKVAQLVERVAGSDATVLILGESGTGKELVARAIHALSPRRNGPFVAINCAAIPETLLENELFGHEKGAYTGASSKAIGKVEAAEKGTLFLDEIGEMPLPLQAKILRLLQEKSYDRIGGTAPRKADIRIVTATNRELKAEVEARRFREDLFYRLSVVPVSLPGLRERPEDIVVIARDIVRRLAESLERPGLTLSDDALERLVVHRWPGNVRELENELERAAVMAHGDEIRAADLELRSRVEDPEHAMLADWIPLDGTLAEARDAAADRAGRLRVSLALERSGGDRAVAAEALGIVPGELAALLEEAAGPED